MLLVLAPPLNWPCDLGKVASLSGQFPISARRSLQAFSAQKCSVCKNTAFSESSSRHLWTLSKGTTGCTVLYTDNLPGHPCRATCRPACRPAHNPHWPCPLEEATEGPAARLAGGPHQARVSSEPRSPGLPPVHPELPPALPFSLLFSQNQKKNCAKSGFPFNLQRQVPKSRSAKCAAAAFKASSPPARPPTAEGDAVPSPPALARRWHGTGAWATPPSQGWPSLWPGPEPTSSAERFCLPPPDTLLWANSQLFPRRTPPAGLPSHLYSTSSSPTPQRRLQGHLLQEVLPDFPGGGNLTFHGSHMGSLVFFV